MNNWQEIGSHNIWPPYGQFPSSPIPHPVAYTEGVRIILENGRELIDGISSWWSAAHGYNHPHLLTAAHKQIDIMPHIMFGGLAHQPAYSLAKRLADLTGLDRAFFADSGSIAVEVAMKIALQYNMNIGESRRSKFICFNHSYHGDSFGAMAVSDINGMHKAFKNNVAHNFVLDIPRDEYDFQEFDDVLSAVAEQTAALIIEPLVQGANGMKFYSADILAEIHRLCKKYDILFIADEIATGFARTGSMFACNEAGIIPDIMCLGKGLTGGVIGLAVTMASENIYQKFISDDVDKTLMHGPTYMANPLSCAVANASLDLFQTEPRLKQVEQIEKQLYAELIHLRTLDIVKDVRIKGAIGVVQLHKMDIIAMRHLFHCQNVWIRPFADVIYLMPPLIINENDLRILTNAIITIVQGL